MAANFVASMGKVPAQLKRSIVNDIYSRDVDRIRYATETADRVEQLPGIELGLKPKDQAYASIVNNLRGVMEPAEAIERAEMLTDPRNTALVEQREIELKEMQKGAFSETYYETVEDEFDDANPQALGNMARDYQATFETLYKAGMEEEEARDKAIANIEKNYTLSNATGEMMKYAPEQYYSVDGSADYIKRQLNTYVSKNFIFGEGENRPILVSDDETARGAARGTPDYLLMVVDDTGLLNPVAAVDQKDGKKKFIRWSPDINKQIKNVREKNKKILMDVRGDKSDIIQESLEDMRGF